MLYLFDFFIDALKNGMVLFIDELDATYNKDYSSEIYGVIPVLENFVKFY